MRWLKLGIVCSLSLLAIGCKNLIAEQPQKALLSASSDSAVNEVREVIKSALNGRMPTIASSVFKSYHRLIIERKKHLGPDGNPIQPNPNEKPIIFELYKQGEKCFILDLRNQKQYFLTDAKCSVSNK